MLRVLPARFGFNLAVMLPQDSSARRARACHWW